MGDNFTKFSSGEVYRQMHNRHEIFQIFGRYQIFSFQIISSKVVGFHLTVTKTQFWTGGIGGLRLFVACFRFFHAELSLMPGIIGNIFLRPHTSGDVKHHF